MALAKHKSIKQALEYAAAHPEGSTEDRMNMPAWEHIARNLYRHANSPDSRVVGSIGRATRAQKMILDRLTGTRRAGSHPATRTKKDITFVNLTGGAISE